MNRELKFGMVGNDVADVKRGLCKLGYMDEDNEPGFFSPLMVMAVRGFKKKHRKEYGFVVDGTIDEKTWNAISKELAKEG